MTHTCRHCKRTFTNELKYELHRDTCSSAQLFCDECGERFAERTATRDGWHYTCPTEGCNGEGIGEDIYKVRDARLETP